MPDNHESMAGKLFREKREWRAHVRRTKALPDDYRYTMQQIEKFMWNFAADGQMVAVFDEIVDLFEDGIAEGRTVLEVTGEDVAGFCQSILAEIQAKTWTGKKADELNRAVLHHVAGGGDHGRP
jgi:Uncharacterized protein conserved in bacteria